MKMDTFLFPLMIMITDHLFCILSKENKEIFRWIPPLDEIHKMAPEFIDGINSHRYYRSQHLC